MERGEVPRGKETSIRIVRGDVDERDDAYNCWRYALRKLCAEHLDVSIIELYEQASNLEKIRPAMDKGWTYKGGRLVVGNFYRRVRAIQKNRRRHLCSIWEQHGIGRIAKRPQNIPVEQWNGLIRYWISGKYAEEQAKAARLHPRKGEQDGFTDRGIGLGKPATLATATHKTPGAETPTVQVKGLGQAVSTRIA